MTDLERLKTEIPIADLIGQSFTVTGKGHILTTAEHDSLKIFTNNNSWTWYSQAGRNGKALGGSVIDWVMQRDKCSQGEAIRTLQAMINGGQVTPAPPRPPTPTLPKQPEAWQSPEWQTKASHALETAQDRLLNSPEGEPGREYLYSRGIRHDMLIAWELGYSEAWNIKAARLMPAIWTPYKNRKLTAIQYRFIGVAKGDETADRFGQLKGGKRYLCGVHLCPDLTDPNTPVFGPPRPLVLVEGELNAVSIYQVIYGRYAADVISFGSQGNITNAEVARMAATVASRYKRVIVWTDEPEIAVNALDTLPDSVRRLAIRSPLGADGKKLDANDLLKAGKLDDVVFSLIQAASK